MGWDPREANYFEEPAMTDCRSWQEKGSKFLWEAARASVKGGDASSAANSVFLHLMPGRERWHCQHGSRFISITPRKRRSVTHWHGLGRNKRRGTQGNKSYRISYFKLEKCIKTAVTGCDCSPALPPPGRHLAVWCYGMRRTQPLPAASRVEIYIEI